MAGRPTVTDPKLPLTGRVRTSIRNKFIAICERERRTPSDLVGIVLQDYVAEYEAKNGPLPAPTSAG
jgi:hypothetical protein